MCKTVAVFMTILSLALIPALMAAQAETETPITLQSAIARGGVRADFSGTGSSSGDAILVTVSLADDAIRGLMELTVPRGSYLRSTSPSYQNMVIEGVRGRYRNDGTIVPASKIRVSRTSPAVYLLAAYCANLERRTPSHQTSFVLEEPNAALACILETTQSLPNAARQVAVWLHTNHVDITRANLTPP